MGPITYVDIPFDMVKWSEELQSPFVSQRHTTNEPATLHCVARTVFQQPNDEVIFDSETLELSEESSDIESDEDTTYRDEADSSDDNEDMDDYALEDTDEIMLDESMAVLTCVVLGTQYLPEDRDRHCGLLIARLKGEREYKRVGVITFERGSEWFQSERITRVRVV